MRRAILAIVSTAAALVMLLSFKTHGVASLATPPAAVSSATAGSSTSSGASAAGSSGANSSGSATAGSTTSSTPTPAVTKTVTGDAVDTRYGPVQVQITVTNGKVTAAQAVQYPQSDPRDQQINAYAIPALNQEAVSAGGASIDMISGATYTSDGYIQSLQSALDKA